MSRGALSASAGAVIALASCAGYGAPICPQSVHVSAACGFVSITTDCAEATATCNCCDSTSCVVGPPLFGTSVATSCTINVTLGDGTTHIISVATGQQPGCGDNVVVLSPIGDQSFTSASCQPRRDSGGID